MSSFKDLIKGKTPKVEGFSLKPVKKTIRPVMGRELFSTGENSQVANYFGGENFSAAGVVRAWCASDGTAELAGNTLSDAKYILALILTEAAKSAGVSLYTYEGRRVMINPAGIRVLPEIKAAFMAVWNDPEARAARLHGRKLHRVQGAANKALRVKAAVALEKVKALVSQGFDESSQMPYRAVAEALGLGSISKKTGTFTTLVDLKLFLSSVLKRERVYRLTFADVKALYTSQGVDL